MYVKCHPQTDVCQIPPPNRRMSNTDQIPAVKGYLFNISCILPHAFKYCHAHHCHQACTLTYSAFQFRLAATGSEKRLAFVQCSITAFRHKEGERSSEKRLALVQFRIPACRHKEGKRSSEERGMSPRRETKARMFHPLSRSRNM